MSSTKIKQAVRSLCDTLITPVPPEIKEEFSHIRLRHTVRGLIIFSMVEAAYAAANVLILQRFPVRFTHIHSDFYVSLFSYLAVMTLLVFLVAGFFKKKKDRMLWGLCYLFAFLINSFALLNMISTESERLFLFIFTSTLFIITFVFNFKPRLFIPSAVLFYAFTVAMLINNHYSFKEMRNLHLFLLYIFLSMMIVKTLYYNSQVKLFTEKARIHEMNNMLDALSKTDELTKLNNRRFLLRYMDFLWKQCGRLRLPVSALMIDVDYFKKYNDTLGHVEGDQALIAIAQCLKNQIKRETDCVARFGGEEFVCLLPYMEKEAALNFAKDLVQTVEKMKIPHPMSTCSPYVTISTGVASIIPAENSPHTRLLDEADKALYRAKASGRNQVVAA
ncbi:MAG: GGDEF domain-containing protein [Treponema sp.]|jgi:diguanylate cyclase (GGDEF)-like protein|nr:GGDEF domain-containing protein [Treponema sp.]